MGNDFGEYPLLTQHFNLPTQYQENYDIKYRIYLESMLMQFYGYYECNIALLVLWLSTYFALFSNWRCKRSEIQQEKNEKYVWKK